MEIEEYYPKLLAFSTLRRFYDARARKQSLYFDMEPGAPPPLYESDSPTTERLPASGATDDRAAADHFGLSRGADETTHSDAEEPPPSFRVRSGTEISDALGVRRYRFQRQKSATAAVSASILPEAVAREGGDECFAVAAAAEALRKAAEAEHLATFLPLLPTTASTALGEAAAETAVGEAATETAAAEPEHSDYEDCVSRKSSESHRRLWDMDKKEEEVDVEEEEGGGGLSRKTSDYFDPVD